MTQTSLPLTDKSNSYLSHLKGNSHALDVFKAWGIPTKKNENYKYTNLDKVFPENLDIATADQVQKHPLLETPTQYVIVFDNGKYEENFSELPAGVSLEQVETTTNQASDSLEALNTLIAPHHYRLMIAKNTVVPLITLLQRLDSEDQQMALTSLEIIVESGAKAEFLEVFHSQRNIENTSLSQSNFTLEANAHVHHTKALLTKENHTHVGKVNATLARDSHFTSLTFSIDGLVNRNNVEVLLNEQGAHATLNGLYTGKNRQHQDNFTTIHHNAPHTTSDQIFKGILDDEAHGVFTGKVIIHRNAQLVESSQLNKNLLLSNKAVIDTRPQIEVYADDVKCGHGATVGQINPEEVFYLESRGIPQDKAQKILCHAFAFEAIESDQDTTLTKWLENKLFELFEQYALDKL